MRIQRKVYLTISIFVILAGLMIGLTVFYLFGAIKSDSEALIAQRTSLASLGVKMQNLAQIKNAYYNFENNLKEIDALFINADVPVEFISFLEKISKDNQIKTKMSLLSSGKTGKDNWPYMVFQINTEGSYYNVLRFIQKIENGFYLAEIQNITLSQSGDPGKFDITFLLKVYAK